MNLTTEFKILLKKFGLEYFNRYYSVYRGIVFDNQDPEFLGRLRVKVPQVYGSKSPDKWCTAMGAIAGKKGGVFWIPSIGDPVYVMFEGGDPRFPVWSYGWWLQDSVPENARRQDPNNYVFQTPGGLRIELDDQEDKATITNKEGFVIVVSSSGIFAGKDGNNLGALIEELFDLFNTTTTISYPFDNKLEYINLKEKFKNLLLSNAP